MENMFIKNNVTNQRNVSLNTFLIYFRQRRLWNVTSSSQTNRTQWNGSNGSRTKPTPSVRTGDATQNCQQLGDRSNCTSKNVPTIVSVFQFTLFHDIPLARRKYFTVKRSKSMRLELRRFYLCFVQFKEIPTLLATCIFEATCILH